MVFSYKIIILLTVSISAILAVLLIFRFPRLNKTLKVVGVYLIVSAAIDIVSTSMFFKQENNLKFLHLFTLFEIVIIGHLFKLVFAQLKSAFNPYYVIIPSTLFVLINTLFIQNIESYNSYSALMTSVVIMTFCIYFFLLILDFETQNQHFITLKWFVTCLFILHSISLIVMLFGNMFHDISVEAQSYVWSFRSIVILSTKIILTYFFIKLLFSREFKTQ